VTHPAFIPELCEEEGCLARAVHTLVDDDGSVVGWYCEQHADEHVEKAAGELHYRGR
jgi:hypothetical protein